MDTAPGAGMKEPGSTKDRGDSSSSGLASALSGPSTTCHGTNVPQRTSSTSSINKTVHRQSFAENLRSVPPSPRHRQPSWTQAAIQEILSQPPSAKKLTNAKFSGRDWRDITIGEIVSFEDVRWIEMESSVEEATMALLKSKTNVVLVRKDVAASTAVSTFDYSDLNTYLLVVIGLTRPEGDQLQLYNDIMAKGQHGVPISVREIQPLCRKEPLIFVSSTGNLSHAIEILGSGIHRLVVTGSDGSVVGMLSQLRMVDFFWNEGINFPAVERLYPAILRDLGIGTQQIISINSESPLSDALSLMNDEGLSSIAVVDNGQNVMGNISTKDVGHLTTSSSAPLLSGSCMHFISVILSERGVEKGRDTFPVFYVSPYSTLAHTVAKLIATRSHRMWIVESASPSPSAPATPYLGPQSYASGTSYTAAAFPCPGPTATAPASVLGGVHLSGRLSGVVSLTDILNIFAKLTGLHPSDPGEQRARRQRSSSNSVRPSLESSRASLDHLR